MIVEVFADSVHLFFEGGQDGGGTAFTAGDAADERRIDAELEGYAIIDAAKNGYRGNTIRGTMGFVTFHDAPNMRVQVATRLI